MRLIDADALKDTLLKYNYTTAHNQIFRYIDEQQTAYDVDKVVEQLEKYRENFESRGILPLVNMDYAVKVVRNGGKE